MHVEAEKMINIVANDDFVADYNFGYLCILHGVERICNELYGRGNYKLTVYCRSAFRKERMKDFDSEVIYTDSNPKKILAAFLRKKLGFPVRDEPIREMLEKVAGADLVVGLYPIMYCGSFYPQDKGGILSVLKTVIAQNLLLFLGRACKKPTVKTVCSIGPFDKKFVAKCAKITANRLWDRIYARERESAMEIAPYLSKKKTVVTAPDLANVMDYEVKTDGGPGTIGISVSFQIINQWRGEYGYIESMVRLCGHILAGTDRKVMLIPNEVTPGLVNNDEDVVQKIKEEVLRLDPERGGRLYGLDFDEVSCREMKNAIASCEVLVASRYHSCVAGLSAGVPTLVVGWHWKYQELLELYGQEEWAIPMERCSADNLISKFDVFWEERKRIRETLKEKGAEVFERCMDCGKEMFRVMPQGRCKR